MPRDHLAILALHRGADVLGDALSARPRTAAHKRVPRTRGGLLARVDAWFWRQHQRAVEAYLAQAQNVFELESRIRDLERGVERNIDSRYY